MSTLVNKSITSTVRSAGEFYEQIKSDFQSKNGKQIGSRGLVDGLRKRIKGDDTDPIFNCVSPKIAQEIFDEHLEVKTEVVEKTSVKKEEPPVEAPKSHDGHSKK